MITRYVDTGVARYVYREFPLTSIHPNAAPASEAAICAGQQGKYWEMNEKLFQTQEEWAEGDPTDQFASFAEELGLDMGAYKECLSSGDATKIVKGDQLAGESAGVSATPYFFINDLPIRGGLPIDALGRIIEYVADGGPAPQIVPTGQDPHLRGNMQTAKAITVAFVDYASPDSARHALDVLPKLVTEYVDKGQLIYVLHPLSESNESPGARAAAVAECASEQGKYWEMHTKLFEEQDAWTNASEPEDLFSSYAESLGLESAGFDACLASDWARLRVQSGSVVAALYGVPNAPIFLFNDGSAKEGSPTFEEFATVIDGIVNR